MAEMLSGIVQSECTMGRTVHILLLFHLPYVLGVAERTVVACVANHVFIEILLVFLCFTASSHFPLGSVTFVSF